jgi:cobalt-zinc-cadmium efflux system protein
VHDHGAHQHQGHSHSHGEANRKRLLIAMLLAASYMGAEIVGGLYTGSLALLADAGHMFADVAALALALLANWIASRPSGARWTYGLTRAEILAALVQGAALVAVAALVMLEALERFGEPTPVMGPGMLVIATGGLVVNLIGLWVLSGGRSQSLNVRGAWLHVLSDALGSVGAMTAGTLIWLFGWYWADPAASLAISVLVLFSAWHLLRDAVDVLMEAAPRNLDLTEIQSALVEMADVLRVHDLHVWTIGSGAVCLSCHLVVKEGRSNTTILSAAYRVLGDRFEIGHATIQVEPESFAHETPRSVCSGGCADSA